MTRREFLARLPQRPDLAPGPIPPRPGGPPPDLAAALLEALAAGGCGVRRASTAGEALDAALVLAREAGVTRLGHHDLGPELTPLLPAAAKRVGIELVEAGDGDEQAVALAEPLAAGLTRPELAVAQLGALVHAGDILWSLDDLAARLDAPPDPPVDAWPALTLISGPSKTGDIEAVMVRGVHGPGRVEVVAWGWTAPANPLKDQALTGLAPRGNLAPS
jgi:L-lactate dehydrogenase complex protein LldG